MNNIVLHLDITRIFCELVKLIDKILLRKRAIIESVNDQLKNETVK